MSVRKKILLVAGLTPTILVAIVIAIVALNFRDYGVMNAKEKSVLTAELVRDSLTAHMVNGMMDQREYFLNKIENSKNVESLWLIRGESVDEQFGESEFHEIPKDSIDKDVLKTGESQFILSEDSEAVELRVTIPYIATSDGNPNCLQCHEAEQGEVLGAISMVFDISEIRDSGAVTILRILAISVIFLILGIVIANYLITPYLDFFESLKNAIKKAEEGDFGYRVVTKLKDETGEIARWLNNLYDKLQDTVIDIDKKISILVSFNKSAYSPNPLIRSKEIIQELVDIYKFKRTIEFDKTKDEIYKRIFYVLEEKLGIREFLFFETDKSTKRRDLLYIVSQSECKSESLGSQEVKACRAYRTNSNIYSDDFHKVCESCIAEDSDSEYICLPYQISQSSGIVISIRAKTKEEIESLKTHIPIINNYLDAAKPVIESKILTEMLRESSLRDALTGLYNRRFLEEYLERVTSENKRTNNRYAILMIDIDYFKMVNDTYGHDTGDVIIKGLSETLRENIRESDLAIRFGGEEFLVLLYNPSEDGAMLVADKIRTSFEKRVFSAGNENISKTISLGVSFFPDDGDAVWKAIKFADIALYKAKDGGRNQVVKFSSNMREHADKY
ncbi:MAG: diguanylate cyclase [Campylobacterales bacterium]